MSLLDKINEEIEEITREKLLGVYCTVEIEDHLKLLKALKASREFFEKTMEAEYGEDTGEIMQQWDEYVGRELE